MANLGSDNPSKWSTGAIVVGLVLLGWVVYHDALDHGFVSFDDPSVVTQNQHVLSGLTRANAAWAFTTMHFSNWHPLTWLSLMMDAELGGGSAPNPRQFHRTNLLLHLASVVLLFAALCRFTGAHWRSAVVAGLFAIHPLHVESVVWVAERKGILSTFFWMLTLFAYSGYVARPGRLRLAGVHLAFVCGLLSKQMPVTLPFALLLLDYWPLRRWSGAWSARGSRADSAGMGGTGAATPARPVIEKSGLFALSATFCVVAFLAQRSGHALPSFVAYPLKVRIANAVYSSVVYIRKAFWPSDLAVFYPHPGDSLATPTVVACGALLLAITAVAWSLRRTKPYALVGWLWYLGTLAPVIGLVQVGNHGMADRYTDIPLVGLYLIVAWGGADLLRFVSRRPSLPAALVASLAIAGLVFTSRAQVAIWRNSWALFEHAIAVTSNNYIAHTSLSLDLFRAGDLAGARRELSAALRIKPGYAEAHNNLGNILLKVGDLDGAEERYREAIRWLPKFGEAHANLGSIFARRGDFRQAAKHFRDALATNADDFDTAAFHAKLGHALLSRGHANTALREFEISLRLDPSNAVAKAGLAAVKRKKENE